MLHQGNPLGLARVPFILRGVRLVDAPSHPAGAPLEGHRDTMVRHLSRSGTTCVKTSRPAPIQCRSVVNEMNSDLEELGPIDYLVIEFPGSRMSGEGLPLLVDLVDRGTIRILDLVFIRKMPDGAVIRLDLARPGTEGQPDLSVFDGASSGLLDQGDIDTAADAIQAGSTAGLLVYENRWAAPLAVALRRGGAQLVAGGRIPVQAILASLDAAEAAAQRN